MGGLRVTELAHWLAIPHACLAQTFFCLIAAIALFTSPGWQASADPNPNPEPSTLPRVCGVATLAIYCQLVAGAVQRHAESLVGVALWIHLGGAVVVSVLVFRAIRRVSIQYGHRRELIRPARIGLVLLAVQLLLGGGSFWVRWIAVNNVQPEFLTVAVTTLHVAVGALLLMTSLILTLRSYRLVQMPTAKLETKLVATGVVA
jgi:cytochrome c oxidase assembly protein subunit 15